MSKHEQVFQSVKTIDRFLAPALRVLGSRILYDTGVVLGANLVARALSFLFFVLAARWLPVAEYGVVKYTTSWAATLCILTAPFSLAWTRALAGQVQQHELITWTAGGLWVFLVLLSGTLLVGGVWVWVNEWLDWPALLVLTGLSIFYAYEGYLQGRFAFSKLAVYMILGNGLQLAILGALKWYVPGILSPALVLGLYGIAFVIPIGVMGGFHPKILLQREVGYYEAFKAILRSTLALAIVHNAHSLMLNLDIVLLKHFHGETQVGYYGIAKTLLNLLLVLANAAFAVILPSSAQAKGCDERKLTQTTWFALALMFLLVGILVTFAPQIVVLFFSARYRPAVPALRVLAIGGWFYSALVLLSARGLGQKRDMAYERTYVITLGVNIVLNLMLLPLFNMMGAAWAFVASSIVGGLLAFIEQRRFTI